MYICKILVYKPTMYIYRIAGNFVIFGSQNINLLLALQVKVGKVAYSWSSIQPTKTTKILTYENYPYMLQIFKAQIYSIDSTCMYAWTHNYFEGNGSDCTIPDSLWRLVALDKAPGGSDTEGFPLWGACWRSPGGRDAGPPWDGLHRKHKTFFKV